MPRLKSFAVLAALVGSVTVGCSSAAETTESSEGALGLTACPENLISMVEKDRGWTLFSPNVAKSCLSQGASSTADLETHLASHPFTNLDQKAPFLQECIAKHEAATGTALDKQQRDAVVSNFYFLYNTLKQNSLATLEAIATLDLLVDPDRGPLPEVDGVRYSHPLLHESGDWERRLRRDCPAPPMGIEPLVSVGQNVLWNVRKLNAAFYASVYADPGSLNMEESHKLYEQRQEFRKTRDALLSTFAPWLLGDMKDLTENVDELETMLAQEKEFDLVDAEGNVRPSTEWKKPTDPKNPMVAIDKQLREGLPKQLRKNRDGLRAELAKLMSAAEYLAGRDTSKLSAGEYQEIMAAAVPFDLSTFREFYATDAMKQRFESPMRDLETTLDGLGAKRSPRPPSERDEPIEIGQRMTEIEVRVASLPASSKADEVKDNARVLRDALREASTSLAAQSELESAQCRDALRTKRDQRNALALQLGVVLAITAVTFGATWWLAAARAAVVAGNAARVGLQWAEAARVSRLTAQGAQLLARGGVGFETQVRVLWGGLLAGEGYWLTTGVIDSIHACSEKYATDDMVRYLDNPFDRTQNTCLEPQDAMGKQAVTRFQSCAMSVGITAATTLISGFVIAHGFR